MDSWSDAYGKGFLLIGTDGDVGVDYAVERAPREGGLFGIVILRGERLYWL